VYTHTPGQTLEAQTATAILPSSNVDCDAVGVVAAEVPLISSATEPASDPAEAVVAWCRGRGKEGGEKGE